MLDRFATIESAYRHYDRLGFGPTMLDEHGKVSKYLGEVLTVRRDGLAVVTMRPGAWTQTTLAAEWSKSPVFQDASGDWHFLFGNCGLLEADDICGFSVSSLPAILPEQAAMRSYITIPPESGFVWIREPSANKSFLPPVPAALRFELFRRRLGRSA